MPRSIAYSLALLLLASVGCTSKHEPAYTVVSANLQRHADTNELSKVFHLPADLHGNGWVMRKGTKMTFGSDGSALLETTVYAHNGLTLPNAVQLESIQYGTDGNIQFAVPGNDVGHSLHMRYPQRDYPYSVRFGYKRAYFNSINSVKFACRLLTETQTPTVSAPSGK